MATVHAPTPHPDHPTRAGRATAATATSVAVAAVMVVGGDAAIAAVAAVARHLVDGLAAQWAAAAAVVTAAAYGVAGVPQIHLGRRQTAWPADAPAAGDRRARWAIARLGTANGNLLVRAAVFAIVSIVAGPLAVGLVAGRRHHTPARAHATTAAAALLFGVSWAGAYLGAMSALF